MMQGRRLWGTALADGRGGTFRALVPNQIGLAALGPEPTHLESAGLRGRAGGLLAGGGLHVNREPLLGSPTTRGRRGNTQRCWLC